MARFAVRCRVCNRDAGLTGLCEDHGLEHVALILKQVHIMCERRLARRSPRFARMQQDVRQYHAAEPIEGGLGGGAR
jgi:hypothetical protein